MNISFDVTQDEHDLIVRIADRAQAIAKRLGHKVSKLELVMDLSATHAGGCRLDLKGLLRAPEHELIHDVFGIGRHINRKTGKLENCFVPRFSSDHGM